jgi:uncharacterized protein DUF4158
VVYPQRQPTRYEHVERLKSYLGLRSFTREDHQLIAVHIRHQGRAGARLHELLPSTEQMLRAQAIMLPGVTVLEQLVGAARVAAEEELFGDLSRRIDKATQERILALLQIPAGQRLSPFQHLQRAAGRVLSQTLDEDEPNYHFLLSMQPRHRTVLPAFGVYSPCLSVGLCESHA